MRRHYHRWYSPHLSRDMELLVFGEAGARVIVFPTREGRFYDYENWGMVEAVRAKIENGWIQLICVDSIDAVSAGVTFRRYSRCNSPHHPKLWWAGMDADASLHFLPSSAESQ